MLKDILFSRKAHINPDNGPFLNVNVTVVLKFDFP